MTQSMKEQWRRIEAALSSLGCLDEMALQPGADTQRLAELERHLAVQLPESLKAFLLVHDGQDGDHGLVDGQHLLSVAGIMAEWDAWRQLDEAEMNESSADMMGSEPEGFVKPLYINRGWIPLTKDWGGNSIGLDLDPDHLGTVGQIITFGRDEDVKRVIAPDFESLVELVIASLGSATWNGEYLETEL